MNRFPKAVSSIWMTATFAIAAFALTVLPAGATARYETLYSFPVVNGVATEGMYPSGKLVQGNDGNFYGTTSGTYPGNGATVFKLTPSGTLTTLHRFAPATFNEQLYTYVNSDGIDPTGLILGTDGDFYGTTYGGGTTGSGTIYKITSSGTFTTLYVFSAESVSDPGMNSDGEGPNPLLQSKSGDFYGTAESGGLYESGTVFTITPSGTLTTLYAFPATGNFGINVGGANPFGPLVEGQDGDFYGTTDSGGAGDGHNAGGTVFKITSSGTFTSLLAFNGIDGSQTIGGLTRGRDGDFYGTAVNGGTGSRGTFFKITPTGTLTTLVDFDGYTTGGFPETTLVAGADGDFYGTTPYLGTGTGGFGTVFQVTPHGKITTLHRFSGTAPDGAMPYLGLVQARSGDFYGTTEEGGAGGIGTVYRIKALPPRGHLSGAEETISTGPSVVDLTRVGVTDWISFAHGHLAAFSHKATGDGAISNAIGVGNYNYLTVNAHDLRTCTWSDGTPTATATGDTSSVQTEGNGEGYGYGYAFSVLADKTPRRLLIYAGGEDSAGTLRVSLSDGSAPDFVRTQPLTAGPYDVTYEVTYRAGSLSQTLYVSWTLASGHGRVTLSGAALRPNSVLFRDAPRDPDTDSGDGSPR